MNLRRNVLKTALLVAAVAPLGALLAPAAAAESKVQLMFVQSSESLKADDKTLRLVNASPQTIYFTDRPVRMAGHITMFDYMKEWTAAAGPNNFSKDPPNATLSVYEPGKDSNVLTVVEISQPVIEGRDLVYRYKVIEGKVPATGGATSLFIDWIGPGGGVGAGFHGVGAGGRGVGVR
ncbi:MAG: hypothetical protein V5B31_18375 [Candidatus Accumulibacter propinquus]|uniref:hypothetical protein n=1 Tax=Candidatus Accumulibacter propinquus TaxID=2954380 RepID=UPI002FC28922